MRLHFKINKPLCPLQQWSVVLFLYRNSCPMFHVNNSHKSFPCLSSLFSVLYAILFYKCQCAGLFPYGHWSYLPVLFGTNRSCGVCPSIYIHVCFSFHPCKSMFDGLDTYMHIRLENYHKQSMRLNTTIMPTSD